MKLKVLRREHFAFLKTIHSHGEMGKGIRCCSQSKISFLKAKSAKFNNEVVEIQAGNTSDFSKQLETLFPDKKYQSRIYFPVKVQIQ